MYVLDAVSNPDLVGCMWQTNEWPQLSWVGWGGVYGVRGGNKWKGKLGSSIHVLYIWTDTDTAYWHCERCFHVELEFQSWEIKLLFIHSYCKDRRNAIVIILWYTMLRHNWKIKEMPQSLSYNIPCYITMDYEISPSNTMWRNLCIWSSKSCESHVDFMFQLWWWPYILTSLCWNISLIRIGNQQN